MAGGKRGKRRSGLDALGAAVNAAREAPLAPVRSLGRTRRLPLVLLLMIVVLGIAVMASLVGR
ncbi:MAG TPA: hypothetical protein VK975_05105 [Acidimicrobiales bacterium]|nr:hypothetical protein [Acidimicrobiales bacterium]